MNNKWLTSDERIKALNKFFRRFPSNINNISYYIIQFYAEDDTFLNFHHSQEFKNARLTYRQRINKKGN